VLVARTLAGDERAFAALYRAHAGAVHRLVRESAHDPDVAADLVQEAFTRALEQLASLRDADRFRPWLFAIARHVVADHHRRQARTASPERESPVEVEPSSLQPGPAELAELDELSRLVRGCVAGLPARDAAAVAMVSYLDFTPAEVASALGITTGAAKVAVHRARARLRGALKLAVLVRRNLPGCEEFEALCAVDELAAARHVRACPSCDTLARRELELYAAHVHQAPL
jgi:RNA polymerase sigma factor (sigma-70 family)